jgi:hypothetical protein
VHRAKGNQTATEFGYPHLQAQAQQPLRDAAAINSIRYAIGDRLKTLGLPMGFWSGGRSQYNRTRQCYEKEHWVDAACVGQSGVAVTIPAGLRPLQIKATGRGSRQMCRMDKYGFPRTSAKQAKRVRGFQTGDTATRVLCMVRRVVPGGKKTGAHVGRVAVRSSGSFRVGPAEGIRWTYCSLGRVLPQHLWRSSTCGAGQVWATSGGFLAVVFMTWPGLCEI